MSTDLRDGVSLCILAEHICTEIYDLRREPPLGFNATPTCVANVSAALVFFRETLKLNLRGLLSAEDIVDGNLNLTLGLLFMLYRKMRDSCIGVILDE